MNFRPGAAAIALAISTTAAVVVTPQRPAPQSISTKHSSVVPCFCGGCREVGDVRHVVDADDDPGAVACGRRARRSILAGSRTWFETRMSLMPARAKTSASETFWQQTPTAPPSSFCSFSTSTDLCILPCARWRMLCALA